MKNAAPPVGLKLTAFVAMSSVHRAIHLLHGGWRNWLGFIAMILNYWPCVIICVGFGLVGWLA